MQQGGVSTLLGYRHMQDIIANVLLLGLPGRNGRNLEVKTPIFLDIEMSFFYKIISIFDQLSAPKLRKCQDNIRMLFAVN